MRYFFITLFLTITGAIFAQHDSIPFGAANLAENEITSEFVNASDGVYDKFVLVRWQSSDNGNDYRVFRATSASGASLRELTKNWQKSNWLCDYSAEKGRDYYYAVMESDGKTSTPLSKFDKGFLAKTTTMALEESVSATTPDKYAAGQVVFMLVAELSMDSLDYSAGGEVPLRVVLQNIFEIAASRTDLRVYLSNDPIWDFSDQLLDAKSYSGFPANFKGVLNEMVTIPKEQLPGSYHLIVVTAPEGSILNAKTFNISIKIKS